MIFFLQFTARFANKILPIIISTMLTTFTASADCIQDENVRVLKSLDFALQEFKGRDEQEINKLMGGIYAYIAFDKNGYKLTVWTNETVPHYNLTLQTDEGFIFKNNRVVGVSKIYTTSSMPTGLSGELIETIEKKYGRRKSYYSYSGSPGQVEGLWKLKNQDIVFIRGREHHLLKGELEKLRHAVSNWE